MEKFNSGDHTFTLCSILPKQSVKGDRALNIILDVPYTEELLKELTCFIWKDIKVSIEKSSEGNTIETEFYISDIHAKDYKEGPRVRISLRQPFEQKIFLSLAKLWDNDVRVAWIILQKELFDPPGSEE